MQKVIALIAAIAIALTITAILNAGKLPLREPLPEELEIGAINFMLLTLALYLVFSV